MCFSTPPPTAFFVLKLAFFSKAYEETQPFLEPRVAKHLQLPYFYLFVLYVYTYTVYLH